MPFTSESCHEIETVHARHAEVQNNAVAIAYQWIVKKL